MQKDKAQMDLEQTIERVITKARTIWLVINIFASFAIPAYLGGLWVLIVPLFWVLSYQIILVLAGFYLAVTIPNSTLARENNQQMLKAFQEINKRVQEGTLVPGKELDGLIETSGLNISVILQTSEEKVGTYQGKDIFEWIEINDPISNRPEKYSYETIAELDKSGNPLVPEIEGKYCTLFNLCIYSRPKQ